MKNKEGSTKIINFMTPGAGVFVPWCGHISHIVKMHYFFKYLLLYSQAKIKQTKYIVLMTKEGFTKIINFVTPEAGVLMLGRGHISHYSEYVCSTLSIYSTLVAIMMLLSYTIVDFHLFFYETVDIQI